MIDTLHGFSAPSLSSADELVQSRGFSTLTAAPGKKRLADQRGRLSDSKHVLCFLVASKFFFLSSCRYALKVKILHLFRYLKRAFPQISKPNKYAMHSQENTRGVYCWDKQTWWIRVPLVIIGSFWAVV